MIYDCFTFFNELLLLEVRLNTLNSVVDKFVLVESPYTHSGNNKPLYFEQAKDRPEFAKFKNKIIHIIVENIPLRNHWRNENRQELLKCEPRQPINAKPATGIWQNENHQRRCIKRGLTNLQPDDIVLVSDLDEIPNPDIFPIIQTKQKPCILKQKDYYYYLNCRGRRDGFAAAFCRGRDFIDGHLVRFPEPRIEREIIDNGG
jgi:beta-1,4-mannosyl-glycoprotein beta-1,4-N-acetylglucosaminyltransferase